jgi:flagellar protein FliO/FliZ
MEAPSFLPSLLKMIFALSVVLGIMIAAAYFFRKFLSQPVISGDDSALIHVVSTRYLGPKSSIMLVDVLGELIVIGISNSQMSVLTTISDPQARARLQNMKAMPQGTVLPSFMDQFMRCKDTIKAFRSAGKENTK